MLSVTEKEMLKEIFPGEDASLDRVDSEECQCETEISMLLEEFIKYNRLRKTLSDYQTRYAAINAEIYDLYMAVHGNAIVLSATLAELELKKEVIPGWLLEKTKAILDEYLIFRGFR
ncbi:MAG: hypothetical protein ACYCT2_02105 [Thermoplasmataceae archaeon]